jgi:hypothetical protein
VHKGGHATAQSVELREQAFKALARQLALSGHQQLGPQRLEHFNCRLNSASKQGRPRIFELHTARQGAENELAHARLGSATSARKVLNMGGFSPYPLPLCCALLLGRASSHVPSLFFTFSRYWPTRSSLSHIVLTGQMHLATNPSSS